MNHCIASRRFIKKWESKVGKQARVSAPTLPGYGNDRLRLEIEDTGSGIPAELLAHIFDPWVTTKPHGKGSGLGLSIARQVIASHGGTIRVDNRPGTGAVCTIDLPAAQRIHQQLDIAHAENSRH